MEYSLVTRWRFDAPIESVWEEIAHSERWPSWWKYVESVTELIPGDENGVGGVHRFVWNTALPYRLVVDIDVTRVEKPTLLEVVASGELAGSGRWQLTSTSTGTDVRYDWNVRTTRSWMNRLAPVAEPIFRWNHDVLMGEGGQALARRLGCRFLEPDEDTSERAPSRLPLQPRTLALLAVILAALTAGRLLSGRGAPASTRR